MRIYFKTTLGCLFLLFSSSSLYAADPRVAELEKNPVPELKTPPLQTHTFENGLKLTFLKDDELPIVEMSALIEVGSIYDPADKKGLGSLMMSALRTGGSRKFSAEKVDEILENSAASLEASIEREYANLTLKTTSPDVDRVFPVFFDLIQAPRFDPQRLELSREQKLESLRRRNDETMALAKRKFLQQLYGKENVWARIPTLSTVRSITLEDVVNHHQRFVSPDKIRLAVSGRISFKELIEKIKPLTASFLPHQVVYPQIGRLQKQWKPAVYYVPKLVNQSDVILGHMAEKRFNPDKYALILANYVLGGATFGSRFGQTIRNRLGLAYAAYSSFGLETDYGDFRMMATTKSSSTLQVIREARQILASLKKGDPVNQLELEGAKQSILNTLIFQNEDPFSIVETQMRFDFYGYPPDYLSIYQREINKVTLEEVFKVFRKYFYPDRLIVMIVGNPDQIGEVSQMERVQVLPLDLE